jgi:hypothetical protein
LIELLHYTDHYITACPACTSFESYSAFPHLFHYTLLPFIYLLALTHIILGLVHHLRSCVDCYAFCLITLIALWMQHLLSATILIILFSSLGPVECTLSLSWTPGPYILYFCHLSSHFIYEWNISREFSPPDFPFWFPLHNFALGSRHLLCYHIFLTTPTGINHGLCYPWVPSVHSSFCPHSLITFPAPILYPFIFVRN